MSDIANLKYLKLTFDERNAFIAMPNIEAVVKAGATQLQGFRYDYRAQTATVPIAGDAAKMAVIKWAEANDFAVGASVKAFTAAEAVASDVKTAGTFKNIEVFTARDTLAVRLGTYSEEAGKLLGAAGFTYKTWGDFKDQRTGELVKGDKQYRKHLTEGEDPRPLLSNVDAIVGRQLAQNPRTSELATTDFGPGIAVQVWDSRATVTYPYHEATNRTLDEHGITWHPEKKTEQGQVTQYAGRYGNVSDVNYAGVRSALVSLADHHKTALVPPTPTRPGLWAQHLQALAHAEPAEPKSVEVAGKILNAALSKAEQASIITHASVATTDNNRLAGLSDQTYEQLRTGVANMHAIAIARQEQVVATSREIASPQQAHELEPAR